MPAPVQKLSERDGSLEALLTVHAGGGMNLRTACTFNAAHVPSAFRGFRDTAYRRWRQTLSDFQNQ